MVKEKKNSNLKNFLVGGVFGTPQLGAGVKGLGLQHTFSRVCTRYQIAGVWRLTRISQSIMVKKKKIQISKKNCRGRPPKIFFTGADFRDFVEIFFAQICPKIIFFEVPSS